MTNSTQQEETAYCVRGQWEWLALLPILLLMVLIAGLWVVDLRTEYEWPILQMTLNLVTRTLACLVIAFLAGRSFLMRRQPGLLLMGCGVLIWGASGFIITSIVTLDANLGVTISNLGIWAAAFCHLAGVRLSLLSRRTIPATRFRLAMGYVLALGFVGLITLATFAGWLPLFFVDGQGGTSVRYVVLGSAFVMFSLTAAILWENTRRNYSSFNLWYSYALMLIAIGVFGMLIQTSRGSMLDWMCRISQYLSSIYMLIAALSASRTSQLIDLPTTTEEAWRENGFLAGLRQQTTFGWVMRYGLAVVAVAVATGLRQALGIWVGHGLPPYITYYPAMMAVVVLTGFGPGVLATVLMAMIAAYWILPPFDQFAISSPVDRLGLVIFTGTNLLMCVVAQAYRHSREKAAAYDRESSLRESEARCRSIMDNIQDGFIRTNKDGIVIMASPSVAQLYGLEAAAEIIGMPALTLYNNPEDRRMLLEKLKKHGRVKDYECEALRKDGTSVSVSLNVQYHYNDKGEIQGTDAFVRDITERKQAESFRRMGQDILLVLSEDKNQKESIKSVIGIIKSATGVDAVGIRLQDEDDFPYFYQDGFPEDFLLKENSLLARTKDGGICRDECGDVCLECTCGLVVTSKTDPSSPFFTKGGSAWTNDSIPFLHVPVDIRTNPRDECIHQGFASVALIPIRAKGRVVGLLQLNDRRKGRFTLEGIETLENIAENIGESMLRKQAEESLLVSEERFHSMFESHHAVMLVIEPESGAIVEANAAAARFYGFSNAQLCAMKVQDLNQLPPDEVAAELRNAAEERRNHFVFPHRLANDELRWVEVYSTPWVNRGRNLLFSIIHDITDRKQTELELERMRYMLSEGQRIAHLGSWEYIAATQQTIWSDEQKRIYGLDPTEPAPDYEVMLRNHIHPDDAAELDKSFSEALGSCSIFENENRIVRPDGSIRYIFNRAQPYFDDSGKLVRYAGATLDITDRKQAEEAVLRNQKIFRELIERSPFGTYVVDSQFRIAIMNTSSQAGAFRNVQPLSGRDFAEAMRTLWPEEVAVEIIGHFRHTLDTGEPYYSRDFIKPRHDADIVEAYEWELHRLTLPDGQDGVICYYYDSTKLREAEAAERASRTKLAAAFASMTEAIFIADADGQLMDFNDEFIRYHRFKDRDECSRTIDDCPKYLAAYFADGTPAPQEQWAMPRALRGEIASNVEYRLLRKETGETWWGSYSFAPIKDSDGRIVGAVVSAREITSLKKAEEALRESEVKYRNLFENMVEEVHFWKLVRDEEGQIKTWRLVDANPQTLKSWGRMTLDEVKGKTMDDIFGPGASEHYMPVVQKIMTEGVPYVFEDYFPHLDKHFKFTSVPLGDYFITTGADITVIKKSQEALRVSEQHLRSHIENTPLAVVEWDKDFIVTRWAGEAEKIFGWLADDVVGKPIADLNLVYEPDIPIVQETMAKLTGGNNQFLSSNRNITKDGRVIHCTWYNSVQMDEQGKMESVLSLVQDITGRKQAEESLNKLNEVLEKKVSLRTAELREKDQILLLQSRQAAMGEMIGNIAHQWRQPINMLGLVVQQLLVFYDMGEFDRELLKKNVSISMDLIKHMSTTIDDFRNFFRPDKEKIEFKVAEAIAKSLSLIEDSFKNQHIAVEVITKDDPTIFGYKNEYGQVLLNILNNAKDAFSERASENPKVTLTIETKESRSVVTIADNAGGIPEEILDKIFAPYFTTKGPQQGTGVGLFMSKNIIEKNMGGNLSARNTPGGAEFRIEV